MPDPAQAIETTERELRERLGALPATRALADGVLARIDGGLSNDAWRLDADGASWFVRHGHPGAARLGVDRRSECALLAAVSAAGLAPEVRACDPASGLLVTRYITGRTWSSADARMERNLRRVAERLRRLHELPAPEGVAAVDHEQQARRLGAACAASATSATLAERAAAGFARVRAAGPATTLCHNDLHHLNLVDDGRQLWLVDWEYGGLGNPLFDVAGFLALHDADAGATTAFLDAYGARPPFDPARIDDARWLFDYVQWLWYRARFPDPAAGMAAPAEGLAQRLLRCNN